MKVEPDSSGRNEGLCLQPISILKPVKGVEEGLTENLESFFRLDYSRYELLFSVADASDPARGVIETLIAKHPRIRARLLVGEVNVGPNPKINNLIKSYGEARHDWILISDSNVRAERDYLKRAVERFTPDVGVVTAVVAGRSPAGAGGWLESVFLNTFYARWMLLAEQFGSPVVIGKSMLFRRSEARRFGGIAQLGRYLAEDYMTGQAMRLLGRRIVLMNRPVQQPIGVYSLDAFWSRHIRWGRIRKSQAPLAFLFEPLLSSAFVSGVMGAISLHTLFGPSSSLFLIAHLVLWLACDLVMMRSLGESISFRSALAWLVREMTHVFLWIHIGIGSKVVWRGRVLTLARGGILRSS